jgi:hypothetical protein
MNMKQFIDKNEIGFKFKKIAPSADRLTDYPGGRHFRCTFSASRSRDNDFRWDGDGPDPEDEGLYPYDVTISAKAIVFGQVVEGEAFIGGHYMEEDEEIGNIGGYLPQLLEDAAQELKTLLIPLVGEKDVWIGLIDNVIACLKSEMRLRYQEQRAAIG